MAGWKLELLGEEQDGEITPRGDIRRYGPLILAFVLGWLAALVVPQRIPFP